jgi:hypothetical protein
MNTLPVFDNVFYYIHDSLELPKSVFNLVIAQTDPDTIGSIYEPTGEFSAETDKPYFLFAEYYLNDKKTFHPKLDKMFELHSINYPEDKYTVFYPEDLIIHLIDVILELKEINPKIPIYIRSEIMTYSDLKTTSQIVILNQIHQYLLPLYYRLKY